MSAGKQFRKRITARETGNFLILRRSHRVENVYADVHRSKHTRARDRRWKLGYGYPAKRSIDRLAGLSVRLSSLDFSVDPYLTVAGAFANSYASGVIIETPFPSALRSPRLRRD